MCVSEGATVSTVRRGDENRFMSALKETGSGAADAGNGEVQSGDSLPRFVTEAAQRRVSFSDCVN